MRGVLPDVLTMSCGLHRWSRRAEDGGGWAFELNLCLPVRECFRSPLGVVNDNTQPGWGQGIHGPPSF
jgi:hypothetical protein